MIADQKSRRVGGYILAGIAAAEGMLVIVLGGRNPIGFAAYLGFVPGRTGAPAGWILAAAIVAVYVGFSSRIPSVRATLFELSFLKLLAFAVAISAGILEEVVFRKWIMDYFLASGYGSLVQILMSGLLFGLGHGVWGLFKRSLHAATAAIVATAVLGAALGAVFIVSGRSLAPCVVAHFLIDLLIEPGLAVAAVRGEMGRIRLSASVKV